MGIVNHVSLETPTHTESEHHGGRPLDASRDEVLRASALELLAEIGYDRLTIDKVAARAGAGKATIYRRWSGKAELIVDAIVSQKIIPSAPNTGSLRGDFDAFIAQSEVHDGHLDTEVMIGLVSALPRDEELRDVFQSHFVEPHCATLQNIVKNAEARGEIAAVSNLDLIGSVLPALVLYRLITTGRVPDREFLQSALDSVVLPLLGVRPTNH